MRALNDFVLYRVQTVREATQLLAGHPGARPIAGGTDLIPNLRRGLAAPEMLVDISAVPETRAVHWERDGSLTIGAGYKLAQLAADEQVGAAFPALVAAARSVAATAHRNAATVGGNLCQDTRCVFYNQSEWWRASNGYCLKRGGTTCHVAPQGDRCYAAFCSDLAPVLLAAGAEAVLRDARGTRTVPLAALYRDDGAAHLTLEPGELLVNVRLPGTARTWPMAFGKVRARGSIDFPLAAVCVRARFEQGRIRGLAVAVSGTDSRPLLVEGAAEFDGRPVDDETVKQLRQRIAKQVGPMRTTVTPSQYRRDAACALAERLLRELSAAG